MKYESENFKHFKLTSEQFQCRSRAVDSLHVIRWRVNVHWRNGALRNPLCIVQECVHIHLDISSSSQCTSSIKSNKSSHASTRALKWKCKSKCKFSHRPMLMNESFHFIHSKILKNSWKSKENYWITNNANEFYLKRILNNKKNPQESFKILKYQKRIIGYQPMQMNHSSLFIKNPQKSFKIVQNRLNQLHSRLSLAILTCPKSIE